MTFGSSGCCRENANKRDVNVAARSAPWGCIVNAAKHLRVLVSTQPAARKIKGADDNSEHVIEVVRDAASKLTHCLHFLQLPDLIFRGFSHRRFTTQTFVRRRKFGKAAASVAKN